MAMATRVIGYLVLAEDSWPMEVNQYESGEPWVLCHGNCGTLFRTYDQARCAIRRTLRYARRSGVNWGDRKDLQIMRVREV